MGFLGGASGKKNLPGTVGNARDTVQSLCQGRSPGERNATHSSILACKIPWTEEPGRLQSMGVAKR